MNLTVICLIVLSTFEGKSSQLTFKIKQFDPVVSHLKLSETQVNKSTCWSELLVYSVKKNKIIDRYFPPDALAIWSASSRFNGLWKRWNSLKRRWLFTRMKANRQPGVVQGVSNLTFESVAWNSEECLTIQLKVNWVKLSEQGGSYCFDCVVVDEILKRDLSNKNKWAVLCANCCGRCLSLIRFSKSKFYIIFLKFTSFVTAWVVLKRLIYFL